MVENKSLDEIETDSQENKRPKAILVLDMDGSHRLREKVSVNCTDWF